MTDKTTKALKLAEEALDELRYANDTDIAKTKYYKALAAIRQALANQSIVLNDPHPPHRLCECTACLEYWTPLPDCDAFAASGKPIAEPVKQEPVAWLIPGSITGDKKLAEANGDYATPLYAAPVSAKREWVELALQELQECRDLLKCVETCSRNNFENLADERVQAINAVIAASKEKNK